MRQYTVQLLVEYNGIPRYELARLPEDECIELVNAGKAVYYVI